MFIQQSDLFRDMEHDLIKAFMEISEKEDVAPGRTLFREGDPATHFYVMLKGNVKLSFKEGTYVAYLVSRPGEVFGWSSLFDRDTYSATAEALTETRLVKMPGDRVKAILEKHPESAMRFYRRLCKTLGNRLIKSYEAITSVSHAMTAESHGTGQILSMGTPR
ncbi:Crp/Fnr family transcriptional regulator [Desulfosoma caldarium]|uniref:Cyclic nucleotide-binding protein n=1 Tax=Desulfosoma caldarium TaxID=610254 RepID=A0A3N1UQM3_9BACT|nr:cyclic nucleotide-binding domain-containing protein [Desulfosoma caldarium]ROQ92038.1 cyclic nucleotide-binding protein [Desulfosoma caldarium]